MGEVYEPSEDSYFLSEILKKELPLLLDENKKLRFLEVGAGSGIQLQTALDAGVKKENIFSGDINPGAVKHCRKIGFNCVRSDLLGDVDDVRLQSEAKKEAAVQRLEESPRPKKIYRKNFLGPENHRFSRKPAGCLQFESIKGKYDLIIFNPPYLPEDSREPQSSKTATTGGKNGSEIINRFLKQAKKHLAKDGKIFLLTSSLTKGINWNGWKKKLLGKRKIFFEELEVWELS